MNAQEMMNMDKADLVWRILTLESKIEAQSLLIKCLEDEKVKPKFHPNDITVDSYWECTHNYLTRGYTEGSNYRVIRLDFDNDPVLLSDDGTEDPHYRRDLLKNFKRVS